MRFQICPNGYTEVRCLDCGVVLIDTQDYFDDTELYRVLAQHDFECEKETQHERATSEELQTTDDYSSS